MGLLKNLKDQLVPTPVPLESVRPDLRECMRALQFSEMNMCLLWYGMYGQALEETVGEGESYLAILPSTGLDDYNVRGRGLLVLTSERLLWSGDLNRFEIPMHELTTAGWGYDDNWGFATMKVAIGPSRDTVYGFTLGNKQKRPSWEHFVGVFGSTVRDAERLRHSGSREAVAAPSAADELTKFARLRDDGIITPAEFEVKKQQLLS